MATTLRNIIIKTGSQYDLPIFFKTKKGFESVESAQLSTDGTYIILTPFEFDKENDSE